MLTPLKEEKTAIPQSCGNLWGGHNQYRHTCIHVDGHAATVKEAIGTGVQLH